MKRVLLVAMVSMSLALPALGRPMGSPGGGRSAMGPIMSGPRMGGGAISGSPRSSGGFHGAIGGFRGSVGVPGGFGSGFSLSHSAGFSSRLGSGGWFGSAFARDFGFGFNRRHFDRDVFILSFGYPFLNLYYPFYGSFALGFGYWWYPYYYPYYYGYYPYYPYGYYPGYVYPPPYSDYNRESTAKPSSLADQLMMQWQRRGKLLVGWSGRAAKVQQVEFSLLDSHRQLLALQVARGAPYRTTFSSPPDEAVYLQMAVVYADGSVDSVIRPLPDAGTMTEGSGYY